VGTRTVCTPLGGRTNHRWRSSSQASSPRHCTEAFLSHSCVLVYITAKQTGRHADFLAWRRCLDIRGKTFLKKEW
jgi:hypothetical protein